MCYQKLVIAQKYSAEVRPNFGTRSAPSAKTSASAKHYKGMYSNAWHWVNYARICSVLPTFALTNLASALVTQQKLHYSRC